MRAHGLRFGGKGQAKFSGASRNETSGPGRPLGFDDDEGTGGGVGVIRRGTLADGRFQEVELADLLLRQVKNAGAGACRVAPFDLQLPAAAACATRETRGWRLQS